MKTNMLKTWLFLLSFIPAVVSATSITTPGPKLSSDAVRADIPASTGTGQGAALVAFRQSGAGAVDRTELDKARDRR